MSHCYRPLAILALGTALLAGPLHNVHAQDAPPPPSLPNDPNAPPPPSNPPTGPTVPTMPGIPGGGGVGLPGIPPPPPPPTEMPDTPAPRGPVSLPSLSPVMPDMPMPVQNTPPPLPMPDTAPLAAAPVTLRYKWTPGQTIRYTVTVDVDGSVQVGTSGTTVPIKQHIEIGLHQTVKSVRAVDGAATLAVQVDTMALTMNGQAMPLPPQSQQQIKQPSTIMMTPAGKVLFYQASVGTPGLSSLGINPTDMQNARVLPEQAVSKGDTWRSSTMSTAVGLTTYALYTLNDLTADGSMATIGQKLYGEFKPAKPATTGTSAVPKINGLMTGTATEQFDIAAGQVAAQTTDLELKLTVTPKTTPATSVKTQFHITTDMERVTPSTATPAQPAIPAQPAPTGEPPTGQLQ